MSGQHARERECVDHDEGETDAEDGSTYLAIPKAWAAVIGLGIFALVFATAVFYYQVASFAADIRARSGQSDPALYFAAKDYAAFWEHREMRLIALADELGWSRQAHREARRIILRQAARFERIRKGAFTWPVERESLTYDIDALDLALRHGFCVKFKLECVPGEPPDRAFPKGQRAQTRQKNTGGVLVSTITRLASPLSAD